MFHGEQPPPVGNPFERVAAPVGEADARAEDKHLHSAGDQDLTGLGSGGNPGTNMHGQPGDRAAGAVHFPRVQAGPDAAGRRARGCCAWSQAPGRA